MRNKTIGILMTILCITVSSHAAVFNVNSFNDAVDATIGNGICATAAGQCTLRAAIQEANFANNADTINVPSGLFRLTIVGADEDMSATGDLDILNSVTILGTAGVPTHIDGNGSVTGDRVFEIHRGDVELDLLKVTNGRVDGAGGCIRNSEDLEFTTGEISDCLASGNAGFGGAISSDSDSNLYLEFVQIANNNAENSGGALSVSGFTEIHKVTFSQNTAGIAGGIRNTGTLGIDRSSFSGNGSTALMNLGDVSIESSAFYGNSATHSAGAISNLGTLDMRNCTISGNSSTTGGGGILNAGSSNVTLNNVTIAENSGAIGGGIDSDGTVNIQNSIVALNLRTNGQPSDCSGTITSEGHNLIGNLAGCTVAGDETGNIYNANPHLGPLEDVGGPLFVHLLQSESPAVDAGDDATCESLDQRDVLRPQFASCDIGSVEAREEFTLHLFPNVLTTGIDQNASTNIEIVSYLEFNSQVTLNCIGLPAGMTCAFNPNQVTPPEDGIANSTLTIDPGNSPEGTYKFNIVGVGGASFRSKLLTLVISDALFSDDFEDNDASDWLFSKGTWEVVGGKLSGTVNRKGDAITPDFGGCSNCAIEATIRINSANARVSILGWYQNKKTLVEVQLLEDKNRVVLKQRSAGTTVAKEKALLPINSAVDYDIRVTFDGINFDVTLNGVLLFTVPAGVAPNGVAGFRVKAVGTPANASFEQIRVE